MIRKHHILTVPFFALAVSVFLLVSCMDHKGQVLPAHDIPIKEIKGYVVPQDSLVAPETFYIDESKLKKIPVGIPQVKPTNTNVQIVQMRELIPSATPSVHVSGQDTFALPKMIKAVLTRIPSGMPEEITAKDMDSKDHNPANFSNFNKLQGLKHSSTTCILQDHLGNLWFGTGGGATRYDGKFFTHFTASTGLSNNIRHMAEDASHQLWFGTVDKGLIMYDGTSFMQVNAGKDPDQITCLAIDHAGNIWFGTNAGGVFRFTYAPSEPYRNPPSAPAANVVGPDTSSYTLMHFGKNEGFIDNQIQAIYQDKKGDLWFAGSFAGGGVVRLDFADDTESNTYRFVHFTERQGLMSDTIAGICEDPAGNLWFTGAGGACRYNGITFEKINYKEFKDVSIPTIQKDLNGNLWFGATDRLNTGGQGIFKYAPSGEAHEATLTHYSKEDGMSDDWITASLEDHSGNLWFGSQNGVNKFNGRILTHLTETENLVSPLIMSIAQDQQDNLWFGSTGHGISKYDGKFFSSYSKNDGLCGNFIWSILEDSRGDVWFGSLDGGVSRYTPGRAGHSAIFMNIASTDGFERPVYRIHEDHSGNIWFSVYGGDNYDRHLSGVYRYTPSENDHISVLTGFSPLNGLSANGVFAIEEDNHGNMWFGTATGGVTKYTPPQNGQPETFTQYRTEEGFSNAWVWCISKDYRGNLWFGTNGGGLVWSDGTHFIDITEVEGLINNFVFSILPDDEGNMWFGTRFGLNKLSRKSIDMIAEKATSGSLVSGDLQFYSFTYEDGFLGIGCRLNAICQDRDGTIWIGSSDRVTACHPEGIVNDTTPPNIQLKGVKLFNETVPWDILVQQQDSSFVLGNGVRVTDLRFDDLSQWYRIPKNLSLNYRNNYITFDFIGITMHQPHKVKYRYQLVGMDEHWSAITEDNSAPYGNLPPGSYTFKVKAMSSTGYWSNEFQYPFTIRPPFWRTWWAYGTYGLIALFLVWRIHLFQRARTVRIEREKTRVRELAQAKEIEKAYTELKATQAQLIQSEKMASLGEMTAGIAHEIQNPLNFVNNFSEVNKELLGELREEIEAGNLDAVKSIANDLEDNEEKVTFHGKRADAIVKSMLLHSRSSSGQKELTDINSLCDEYLRLSYHGLRAKDKSFNAEFHTDLDPILPKVEVVRQDIGRVLLNLVNNAFYAVKEKQASSQTSDASNEKVIANSKQQTANSVAPPQPPQGREYKPEVTVSTKNLGATIEIRVKDNGNGIPQNILNKVFQPFFTTKPTGQGTGLGLSLSYDIVKAHSGELKVETTPGEGSEFILVLPI